MEPQVVQIQGAGAICPALGRNGNLCSGFYNFLASMTKTVGNIKAFLPKSFSAAIAFSLSVFFSKLFQNKSVSG